MEAERQGYNKCNCTVIEAVVVRLIIGVFKSQQLIAKSVDYKVKQGHQFDCLDIGYFNL